MLEEMASFFERRLDGYDEHMLTDIEGAEAFYPFTAALLPSAANCTVLDLGCGTGLELEAYFARNPSAQVVGVDLSEGMLSALRRKFPGRRLDLVHGSYFDIPLGCERFDAAVSVESLHHFTLAQKVPLYQKLFSALKAGGYFVLTDYFAESEAHEQAYFETLHRLMAEQGLSDRSFFHYDTPLTVEHEMQALRSAGFSNCEILSRWGATCILRAAK